jgi:hypothetical protein
MLLHFATINHKGKNQRLVEQGFITAHKYDDPSEIQNRVKSASAFCIGVDDITSGFSPRHGLIVPLRYCLVHRKVEQGKTISKLSGI